MRSKFLSSIKIKRHLRLAFKNTLPILFGYVFMGASFGVLLAQKGYSFEWAIFMGVFIYSGAMQFLGVGLLAMDFSLLNIFLVTLSINSRQIFYAISMLSRFKNIGFFKKIILFHTLTDESFAIINKSKSIKYMMAVNLLSFFYWNLGGVIGVLVGNNLPFSSKGIEFIMSAIFIVIFLDNIKANARISFIGLFAGISSFLILGSDFLFPSILISLGILLIFKRSFDARAK